jgi:DNA polymerase V
MMPTEFIPLAPKSKNLARLASVAVVAGEPAEISNEIEPFDFNEHLTNGSEGVYFVRVVGDSMENEIFHGDLLIVNRNLQASDGDKIIASVNGSFTVKIFSSSRGNRLRLVASNEKYEPQEITRRDDFEIFGVVTHVIHQLKKI